MKQKIYTALSVAVIAILLYFLFTMHVPYVWVPTFEHKSKEPLGCAMFDSLMSASLPQGYEVKSDVPKDLDPSTDALLYCKVSLGDFQTKYENKSQEIARGRQIMNFVARGGHVIVATANINNYSYDSSKDSLLIVYGLEAHYNQNVIVEGHKIRVREFPKTKDGTYVDHRIDSHHTQSELDRMSGNNNYRQHLYGLVQRMKDDKQAKDTLTWVDGNEAFEVSPLLTVDPNLWNLCTTKHRVLMTYKFDGWHKEAVAFQARYTSGGSITFVATPLLFTNYAVMDPSARQLTQRLIAPVKDLHLVRIEGRNKPSEKELIAKKDDFSFIRRHQSLKYAMYVFLTALILAFINYSRRRMRAIPLPPVEKNVTLDFARFMGTFHYRRHDYKQVLLSQYQTMLHQLGEVTIKDVDRMTSSELKDLIVDKTQLPPGDVGMLTRVVLKLQNTDETLTQEDMMKLLDVIRQIKEKL